MPCLRTVASAVRKGRALQIGYKGQLRVVGPLGLVNKAGAWYLVAVADGKDEPAVFRVGRIGAARELGAPPVTRPAGFGLAAFWAAWSAAFEASRPRIEVRLRASPSALRAFPEVFGGGVRDALAAAGPPDPNGWREVTLAFEHDVAAGHKLAGFGGQVQVLSPAAVRDWILGTARETLALYS